MRCPNCNKFVAYDTDVEPEEEQAPSMNSTVFEASYQRVLTCEECGDELKEGIIEFSYDMAGDVLDDGEPEAGKKKCSDDEHVWEIDDCQTSPTTNTVGKGRRPKTFYGVKCDVQIKCSVCGVEHEFSPTEEMQASEFEELV